MDMRKMMDSKSSSLEDILKMLVGKGADKYKTDVTVVKSVSPREDEKSYDSKSEVKGLDGKQLEGSSKEEEAIDHLMDGKVEMEEEDDGLGEAGGDWIEEALKKHRIK